MKKHTESEPNFGDSLGKSVNQLVNREIHSVAKRTAKRIGRASAVAVIAGSLYGCAGVKNTEQTPVQTPISIPTTETITVEPTAVIIPTETPIPTLTPTPKVTSEPTVIPTNIPKPTATLIPAPTETQTPTPTPTPEISPVEKAIKDGKIELNSEQDWEKYFKAVTPQEAEKMLAEANAGVTDIKDYKVILPIRSRTNISIKDFEFHIQDIQATMLGIDNVPEGSVVYSPISGTLKMLNAGIYSESLITWVIEDQTGNIVVTGSVLKEGNESSFSFNEPIKVNLGDPILKINNKEDIKTYGHQIVYCWYYPKDYKCYGSISSFLKDGDGRFITIPEK